MTDVYQSTERNALAETEDPHKLVLIMFDALIKSMEIYIDNIDLKTADLELRSKHFSRSLTIIYSLQSSLDFERRRNSYKSISDIRICEANDYRKHQGHGW